MIQAHDLTVENGVVTRQTGAQALAQIVEAMKDLAGLGDDRDPGFDLKLWFDDYHDGVEQPAELRTLQEFNIRSISLQFEKFGRTDQYGNGFLYRARLDVGGTQPAVDRWAYDLFLTTAD